MWSSAAVAHLLQGSTCCAFRDGILHTLVVIIIIIIIIIIYIYIALQSALHRRGESPQPPPMFSIHLDDVTAAICARTPTTHQLTGGEETKR